MELFLRIISIEKYVMQISKVYAVKIGLSDKLDVSSLLGNPYFGYAQLLFVRTKYGNMLWNDI